MSSLRASVRASGGLTQCGIASRGHGKRLRRDELPLQGFVSFARLAAMPATTLDDKWPPMNN
jgi:hypothetical protein